MKKVCILLVLLTCVYHDARFRKRKFCFIIVNLFLPKAWKKFLIIKKLKIVAHLKSKYLLKISVLLPWYFYLLLICFT
jgi:hypothetical protein